ncbi:MAG TPA: hypothetical protein PKE40_02185 [Arachnia sp.]|nr:hypothetical protein [Arachnia sp.]HMT85139.1 hypothetical protein [Arachnia sp.]
MAVLFGDPPAGNVEVLRAHFPDVAPEPGAIDAYLPHRVFVIGGPDLLAGHGLGAARFVAWRYVVRSASGEYRAVEIAEDAHTGDHTLLGINSGRHVDQFVETRRSVAGSALAAAKDYEVNVVRVPACYVVSAWAGGVGHDDSVLIPLAPAHRNFVPGQAYTPSAFVTVLEKTAREAGGPARRLTPRRPIGDGFATDGGMF